MARILRSLCLLLLLMCVSQQLHTLEFMDADESVVEHDDDDDFAELPSSVHSYSKDTIANYNPRKLDANFKALWERVPLNKQDVIKRK